MDRALLSMHRQTVVSQPIWIVGTLLLCAFALFLCANHSRKWRKWKSCYGYYRNDDPIIELNNETVIDQFERGDKVITPSGDEAIWKKNILMGGKCQLPDFSGVIIYDSAGNVVPPAKPPPLALTWK